MSTGKQAAPDADEKELCFPTINPVTILRELFQTEAEEGSAENLPYYSEGNLNKADVYVRWFLETNKEKFKDEYGTRIDSRGGGLHGNIQGVLNCLMERFGIGHTFEYHGDNNWVFLKLDIPEIPQRKDYYGWRDEPDYDDTPEYEFKPLYLQYLKSIGEMYSTGGLSTQSFSDSTKKLRITLRPEWQDTPNGVPKIDLG